MHEVGGYGMMLVDFGRSIGLDTLVCHGSDPIWVHLKGPIAAEDRECASICNKGMSWGVDLDLFGLAASSFTLMFGSHIKVTEDKRSGKWSLEKLFRRYWQRDLWSDIFDSLLNFNPSSDEYCLRDIRIAFDDYISGK